MDVLSNMAMENHNLSLGDASWSIGPHFFPLLCVPGLFVCATSAVHLSSWGSWPFSCSHHPDENHLASKVKGKKKQYFHKKSPTTPGDSKFKPWPFFYPKTLGLSLNQPSPKGVTWTHHPQVTVQVAVVGKPCRRRPDRPLGDFAAKNTPGGGSCMTPKTNAMRNLREKHPRSCHDFSSMFFSMTPT